MADEQTPSGLHIDSDWKEEAAREKQRLAAEAPPGGRPDAAVGQASFVELVNLIAMQAVVGLGGYQGPGGERIPPNAASAKHFIDLLEVLEEKTKGNLGDEEKKTLDAVLYELRMQYVSAVGGGAPRAPGS